ncbi:MAG: FG-GAP repeat protein [Burkholderiales bacterium]
MPYLVLALLLVISGHSTAEERNFVLHPALGTYTLLIQSKDRVGHRLSILDRTGTKIQDLDVESTINLRESISVIDVDGDGYKDLVIAKGYAAGPFALTSLYRFNPQTRLFEEDQSFPGEDFPTPAPKRGCIYLESRLPGGKSIYYYEITEWCLSRATDQWVAGTSCSSQHSCYKRLASYRRAWHKKQSD